MLEYMVKNKMDIKKLIKNNMVMNVKNKRIYDILFDIIGIKLNDNAKIKLFVQNLFTTRYEEKTFELSKYLFEKLGIKISNKNVDRIISMFEKNK